MKQSYPVLPLRDIVVFPHMIVPLFVGRDKSVAALESAMAADKSIFLVSQLDPAEDDPDRDALYDLGVVATVLQLLKLPDGTVRVLVEGRERASLTALRPEGSHLVAEVALIETTEPEGAEVQALMRSTVEQFENYSKFNKKLPAETAVQLGQIEDLVDELIQPLRSTFLATGASALTLTSAGFGSAGAAAAVAGACSSPSLYRTTIEIRRFAALVGSALYRSR